MIDRSTLRALTLSIAVVGTASRVPAETTLASPFGEHMVLQANAPIVLFGTDRPGTAIDIRLADQSAETDADADGRWIAELPAMSEPGPHALTARGTSTIELTDVLVGEVWWCSGQSNMAWPVEKSDMADEVAKMDVDGGLRLRKIPPKVSGKPLDNADGLWTVADRESAAEFSAVALAFGQKLRQELNRPVGLYDASRGGSTIRAWLSEEAFSESPHAEQLKTLEINAVQQFRRRFAQWKKDGETGQRPKAGWAVPFKRSRQLYNGVTHPFVGARVAGVLWYQGEADSREPDMWSDLFTRYVRQQRKVFDDESLPVLFVQLPGYRQKWWPAFREAQRRIDLPGVDMAVTLDLGDKTTVHPTDKRPVGDRLARLALSNVYGRDVVAGGPRPTELTVTPEGTIEIEFDRTGGGLIDRTPDSPVRGFWGFSPKGTAHRVEVAIDGDKVVLKPALSADRLRTIRYAHAPFPPTDLANDRGLPAGPFELPVHP